ncbi:uncharacterized protein [Rutidosis leptorrhynchoides]|uniref:uncharacterized protein n=1 Tax=Rutidosis leptorrhynchoides TaxID=125765 RepID=UPI003A99E5D3
MVEVESSEGVLCDKKVPLKLNGKFFKVVIRSTMFYGSECWPMTKAQERKMEVVEMRMLRWMCAPVRRVKALTVGGVRRNGRPRRRLEDRLKLDMKELLLTEDMTSGRNLWRSKIKIIE